VKTMLEKNAVCASIGAVVLVDDTLEILSALHTGLYHGKTKEIKGLKNILGILFTGDKNYQDNQDNQDNQDKKDNSEFPVANTWEQVVKICEELHKKMSDGLIPVNVPDKTIDITKYVYCDLCVPTIEKQNFVNKK
jgi:hypothetical protein